MVTEPAAHPPPAPAQQVLELSGGTSGQNLGLFCQGVRGSGPGRSAPVLADISPRGSGTSMRGYEIQHLGLSGGCWTDCLGKEDLTVHVQGRQEDSMQELRGLARWAASRCWPSPRFRLPLDSGESVL